MMISRFKLCKLNKDIALVVGNLKLYKQQLEIKIINCTFALLKFFRKGMFN